MSDFPLINGLPSLQRINPLITSGNVTAPDGTNLNLTGGNSGASLTLTTGPGSSWITANKGIQVTNTAGPTSGRGLEIAGDSTLGYVFAFNRNSSSSMGLALQHVGGNVLVATSTDSANGRLQLAAHSSSAGGIGFGTDVTLYRSAANSIFIGATTIGVAAGTTITAGGSSSALTITNTADASSIILKAGTTAAYGYSIALNARSGSDSMVFSTRDTTALTLDSSQNATFSGFVKAQSFQLSADAQGGIISSVSNTLNIDAAAGDIRVRPKPGSAFVIGNSAALKLGNAYVAGAPTATGYITIQDSTGTTYKIPAVAA